MCAWTCPIASSRHSSRRSSSVAKPSDCISATTWSAVLHRSSSSISSLVDIPSPSAVDGQDTRSTLARLCVGGTAHQNGPARQLAAVGNGGAFLSEQCEDLRALLVEMNDTLGATLGTYHGANSLGLK